MNEGHPTSTDMCFVIMPFTPAFDKVYKKSILPAANDQNVRYNCRRVDILRGAYRITDRIVGGLFSADVVIADTTSQNPNVMYELGTAHTVGRKTIMIAQSAQDLPFDINAYRAVIYNTSEEGLDRLRQDLIEELCSARLGTMFDNPVQDSKPHSVDGITVYPRARDNPCNVLRLMRDAQAEIIRVGCTLQGTVNGLARGEFETIARRGVRIRLFFLHPESYVRPFQGENARRMIEQIQIYRKAVTCIRECIEVYVYHDWAYHSMTAIDFGLPNKEYFQLVPYIANMHTEDMPLYIFDDLRKTRDIATAYIEGVKQIAESPRTIRLINPNDLV